MKKFIHKTIIFIAPVIGMIFLMEGVLKNIPNDYSYKCNYLNNNSNKIEVLILGSSHAYYGIDPSLLSFNSFNASHSSQTIDYDYYIFNKYFDQWKSLRYIFITISYFTLFTNLDNGAEAWRAKNYSIYYDISTSLNINNHFEILNGTFADNFKRVKRYLIYNKNDIMCTKYGYGLGYNPDIKNDIKSTGIQAAKRHTEIATEDYYQNLLLLRKIISYAGNNNIQVVLFTPPAHDLYIIHLDQKQLEITIEQSKKLDQENNHVKYINFLYDKSFIESDFFDADHLNTNGAKKLTKKINNYIQSYSKHI